MRHHQPQRSAATTLSRTTSALAGASFDSGSAPTHERVEQWLKLSRLDGWTNYRSSLLLAAREAFDAGGNEAAQKDAVFKKIKQLERRHDSQKAARSRSGAMAKYDAPR